MTTTKTRDIQKHDDGGHTQTVTLTYFIVRFVSVTNATLTGRWRQHACYFLRDKNTRHGKRRKWDVQSSDWATYRFETRGEAMKGVRSATVQKWLDNRNAEMLTEVVEVVETEIKIKHYAVVERPGCNPLLTLALEAE